MRRQTSRLLARVAVAGLLLVTTSSSRVAAQVTTGTFVGSVADASQAVLASASVTATNLDTGFTRSVQTERDGTYTIANVPIGRYELRAEAQGFRAAVVSPVRLVVDQRLRTDFALAVGALTETLEVRGSETLLQTDQPDMNQIVQEREIKNLPLNGRDFFSLLLLSNGVQDTSNDQGGATTNVTFSINGMRPEANSVTLDGVQISSVRESDVDLRPNVDAISEFKVLTSTFSAEYGHTAGGVISIQSKSGTNAFHGSLWEFHRNDALNASNFFRNPLTSEKASLKQNQFGGAIGGPVRRNKTFFFGDYQGETLRRINEAFAYVPEPQFRNGDFSSILPSAVIDPRTGQPFPGNVIPPGRFSEFGWALLNAPAEPNLPNDYPLGNYFIRQPHDIDSHEGGVRVDHVFSPNDNMFFRYRMKDLHLDTADALGRYSGQMPRLPARGWNLDDWQGISMETGDEGRGIVQGGIHDDRNHNAVLSHVHLFGTSLVSETRLGFHRYELDVLSHAHGKNLASATGLTGVNDDILYSGLPAIYLNAYTKLGGDDFKPLYFKETFWQANETLTYSHRTAFVEVRRRVPAAARKQLLRDLSGGRFLLLSDADNQLHVCREPRAGGGPAGTAVQQLARPAVWRPHADGSPILGLCAGRLEDQRRADPEPRPSVRVPTRRFSVPTTRCRCSTSTRRGSCRPVRTASRSSSSAPIVTTGRRASALRMS